MIELRMGTMRRTIKYEKKARKSEKKIVVECIKDLEKERRKGEESKWKKARNQLLRQIGITKEEIKRQREEGNQEIVQTVVRKIWEKDKEERQKKIEVSKYNALYKYIMTGSLLEYLMGKKKATDRRRIARYRCGNEWKKVSTGEKRKTGRADYVEGRKKV